MIRDLVAAVSQTAGMLVAELERIIPIIVFLLAAAVLAELSDRAGVFDVVGHWLARQARHRLLVLWLLFSAYAVICTVFLSLDTTAVLLTPVALAIAKQVGVPARPFALTTLWIANTGSMLLPVSNLTNLLAQSRFRTLGVDHTAYLRLALVPGLVSIVVTLVVILALHPRVLTTQYTVDPPAEPHDQVLLRVGLVTCLLVGPAFAAGLAPWAVAGVAAGVLLLVTWLRAPHLLRGLAVPWVMAAGFAVLALLVGWAQHAGHLAWLGQLVGQGTGLTDLLRVTGTAALTSNLVNNLPAYLAVEPFAADHPARLMAALVGANAGPLVTPWASLATLLWLQRCRAGGLRWRLGRLALAGLGCALASTVLAVLALALVTG